jgi:ABC-type transporter Mla MlaB component
VIEIRRQPEDGDTAILILVGELTIFTASETHARLLEAAPAALSLQGVERIDSAGLQVLMSWCRSGEGRSVRWASAPQPVLQLLHQWCLPLEESLP